MNHQTEQHPTAQTHTLTLSGLGLNPKTPIPASQIQTFILILRQVQEPITLRFIKSDNDGRMFICLADISRAARLTNAANALDTRKRAELRTQGEIRFVEASPDSEKPPLYYVSIPVLIEIVLGLRTPHSQPFQQWVRGLLTQVKFV